MSDALLGGRVGSDRELLIVALPVIGVAQYATGMIDEAQRFFDVTLAVAGLRVIFAYQTTQRGAHLLVRGGLRNPESFVQRGFHGRESRAKTSDLDVGIFR